MGYPLRMEEFGGGVHLRDAGRPGVGRLRQRASTTAIRCSIRTSRSSTSSGIRSSRRCSSGGQMVRYGAKALPEGGWHTIPRVYADGVLIAGDAGGFLNSMRLKGIHLAMRTGMLAAETAFEAVRAGDTSAARLKAYDDAIDGSDVRARAVSGAQRASELQLRPARRRWRISGLSLVTGGWWFRDPMPAHAGYERMAEAGRLLHGRAGPIPSRRSTRRRSIASSRSTG